MASPSTTSSTNRLFSLGLLALGITLIVLGVIASDSVSSDISRLFTGGPTDKSVWLLVGGSLSAIAGLAGLARG